MSSSKNGEQPPSRFSYLLQLLPERMRPKKAMNAQNLLPLLLSQTHAKDKTKQKRRIAIAIVLGAVTGILCDMLPAKYQVGCAVIAKLWRILATLLGVT